MVAMRILVFFLLPITAIILTALSLLSVTETLDVSRQITKRDQEWEVDGQENQGDEDPPSDQCHCQKKCSSDVLVYHCACCVAISKSEESSRETANYMMLVLYFLAGRARILTAWNQHQEDEEERNICPECCNAVYAAEHAHRNKEEGE